MKTCFYLLFGLLIFASCTSQKNSEAFIKKTTGRYLFNANEVIEIYFKDQFLHVKWRDNHQILPLKVNDSSFYIKEMNEKIVFVSTPEIHIKLAEKREHNGKKFHFQKMETNKKTASEFMEKKEYAKALNAFLTIQKKDSLNPTIKQRFFNDLGYNYMNKKDYVTAIEVFKINVALYPKNSNSYNRLANAYLKNSDTIKAIENYKKALEINPENRHSIRSLKRIKKDE